MAGEGVKCAPLCQHPGCWNSGLKVGHAENKNSEYVYYLSELLSRRRGAGKQQVKDGTFTSDGLPTLKVHTVDHTDIEYASGELSRRSRTLPPLQLCSRTQLAIGGRKRSSSDKLLRERPPGVKYLQMNLEVDDPSCHLPLDQLTFSPVLIWKPASKAPTTHTHPSSLKHSAHTHTPVPAPSQTPQGAVPLRASASGVSKVGSVSEGVGGGAGGRKSPLLIVKTTDLTQGLPGQGSNESVAGEKKATVHTQSKGRKKLSVGDTESYSYLGDIPPHVVAEILQQLRSESSSSIDGSHSQSPIEQKHHHSKAPGGPSHPTHTTIAAAKTHLPSSIAYNLSSKKVSRRTKKKQQTDSVQKRRVSSFSRELSKHPLEVLKHRSAFSGWVQNSEQSPLRRTRTERDHEPNILNEDTLTDVTKMSPHKTVHVATTLLEPPVAMGNRSRYMAPRLLHVPRETSSSHTGPSIQPRSEGIHHTGGDKTIDIVPGEREGQSSPLLSPRRITMDLGVNFRDTSVTQSGGGGERVSDGRYPRVKPHIVHLPRHHLSVSASTHRSARAFSEDNSTLGSPEHGVHAELVACGESFTKANSITTHHKSEDTVVVVETRTSVSPDYMLVGAHFAGDHLVLSDRGGNVVHHNLNESESDANIVQFTEQNVSEMKEQDIPKIESFDSKELLEKPTSGVRAPPSTAAELEEEARLVQSERFGGTIAEEPGGEEETIEAGKSLSESTLMKR